MSVKRHPALVVAHYGTLILLAVVCVAPIILMFATSLKLQTQIFNTGIHFIFAPTLENYRDVLGEDSFKRYLGNSLMVGVVSTVITLVLGCMAAYGPSGTSRNLRATCRATEALWHRMHCRYIHRRAFLHRGIQKDVSRSRCRFA